jgi:hypothetical protein
MRRHDPQQQQLEAELLQRDANAAISYLRRFVDGEPIDQWHVLRALTLAVIDQAGGEA